MLGLAYAVEACIHRSKNPLNLVAHADGRSELAQIASILRGRMFDVRMGQSISRVIAAHLTPEHTSVDLIGHGRGNQIEIGDWGLVAGYQAIGAAMATKKVSMLRLLACEQAFLRSTRKALRDIQVAHFTKYSVALSVAGGKVFSDQFNRDRKQFDNSGACSNLVFPDLLRELFSGVCPAPAGDLAPSPSGWKAMSEAAGLELCLSEPGLTISVDSDDARRCLSCPIRRPVAVGPRAFSMCLPCQGGVLAGAAYAGANSAYLLFPHERADVTSMCFLLDCGNASSLFNRDTAALYWR